MIRAVIKPGALDSAVVARLDRSLLGGRECDGARFGAIRPPHAGSVKGSRNRQGRCLSRVTPLSYTAVHESEP